MSCEDCPDMIVETLAAEVRRMMWRVQRIRQLTSLFDRLLSELAANVLNLIKRRLDELYALIPEPPVADLAFYAGLLTCPLTPLALAIDPSLLALLDPREVLKRYKRCARLYLDRAENYYDIAMADLEANDPRPLVSMIDEDYESLFPPDAAVNSGLTASAWAAYNDSVTNASGPSRTMAATSAGGPVMVPKTGARQRVGGRSTACNVPTRMARKYVREVVVALQDPVGFAAEFSKVQSIVAQVRTLCPTIYYSSRWPFRYWDDTVAGFDFDGTTYLPGVIKGGTRDIAAKFMQIEAKLFRWQAFIAAPL